MEHSGASRPAACALLFASVYKVEQASDGSHLPGSATCSATGCAPLYTLAAGDELWVKQRGQEQSQGFCSSCQALFLYQWVYFSFLHHFHSLISLMQRRRRDILFCTYRLPRSSCTFRFSASLSLGEVFAERESARVTDRERVRVCKSEKERCGTDLTNPFLVALLSPC